jgi:hypothetical protein
VTRKDFKLIAEVIRSIYNASTPPIIERYVAIAKFGIMLQGDNPRFDYNRFVIACSNQEAKG